MTQFLVLLYAALDTLAWLASPDSEATGKGFQDWTDRYLLPDSSLPCTSADLWGARCGVLHTHGAESRSSASGKARQIWYYGRDRSKQHIEEAMSGRADIVAVRTVDLIEAFAKAAKRFSDDLGRDPELASRAQAKVTRWLQWVPA